MSLNTPNKEEFVVLAETFRKDLIGMAKRYCSVLGDAEDAVQDALIYCYGNLDKFNPEQSSLKSWVTNVTISKALRITENDTRRTRLMTVETDFPDTEHVEDTRRAKAKPKLPSEPGYDPQLELVMSVHQALLQLSDKERDIATKVLLEGSTVAEYTEETGIAYATVYEKLETVKAKLRDILKDFRI